MKFELAYDNKLKINFFLLDHEKKYALQVHIRRIRSTAKKSIIAERILVNTVLDQKEKLLDP